MSWILLLQNPHSAFNLQLPICQHKFKEKSRSIINLAFCASSVTICVSTCIFNVHVGGGGRGRG